MYDLTHMSQKETKLLVKNEYIKPVILENRSTYAVDSTSEK